MQLIIIFHILLRVPSLFYLHTQDSVHSSLSLFSSLIRPSKNSDSIESSTYDHMHHSDIEHNESLDNFINSASFKSVKNNQNNAILSKKKQLHDIEFSKIVIYYFYKWMFFLSDDHLNVKGSYESEANVNHYTYTTLSFSSNKLWYQFVSYLKVFLSYVFHPNDIDLIGKKEFNFGVFWIMDNIGLFLFFGIAFLPILQVLLIYKYIIIIILCLFSSLISKFYISQEFLQANPSNESQLQFDLWNWFQSRFYPQNPPDDYKFHIGIISDHSALLRGIGFILLHCIIGTFSNHIFSWNHSSQKQLLVRFIFSIFTLPILAYISCICSASQMRLVHNFSSFFVIMCSVAYLLDNIGYMIKAFKDLCIVMHNIGRENGIFAVPFHIWHHYNLAGQLLIFWLSLFVSRLVLYLSLDGIQSVLDIEGGYVIIILRSLSESCETPLCLLALCVTVSFMSYSVLCFTNWFLHGAGNIAPHDILHRGWAEAITFLLVAVQTDLTTLKSSQRANLMIIVIFILLSSLLDSIHEIVAPHLLSLGAAYQNTPWNKHIKALFLATVLWIAPIYMTVCLYRLFEVDFWLLIIVMNSLLTTVQMLSTVIIYAIFIFDEYQSGPSEQFDNLVFYIKSIVRVVEFVVAVVVVGFGLKECLFGSWSIVSFIILLTYFWFNVFKRIQDGWTKFLLRQKAAKRLNALKEASKDELKKLNDVCSICFSEMKEARRTSCNHYFHSFCLKRWLYIRDTCPLCQKSLDIGINTDNDDNDTNTEVSDAEVDVSDTTDSELYRQAEEDDGIDLGIYCSSPNSSQRSSESEELNRLLSDETIPVVYKVADTNNLHPNLTK